MTKTVGELKEWLNGFDDNEIFVWQVWTADDFGVDGKTPSQDLIAELRYRFWRDEMTNDTQSWLDDVLSDIVNEKRANL